jgi:hypothetical protein
MLAKTIYSGSVVYRRVCLGLPRAYRVRVGPSATHRTCIFRVGPLELRRAYSREAIRTFLYLELFFSSISFQMAKKKQRERQRKRETENEREIERETERQKDRQTEKERDKQTDR